MDGVVCCVAEGASAKLRGLWFFIFGLSFFNSSILYWLHLRRGIKRKGRLGLAETKRDAKYQG
jgi:hypothetical protein